MTQKDLQTKYGKVSPSADQAKPTNSKKSVTAPRQVKIEKVAKAAKALKTKAAVLVTKTETVLEESKEAVKTETV